MTTVTDKRLIPAAAADDRGRAMLALMTRIQASFDWKGGLALDVADIPTTMLPYAIRSLGLQDYVEPGMKEAYVRSVVVNALPIKVQEGTIKGVRYALSLLGMTVSWTQWHQRVPLGAPGTHVVVVTLNERLFDGEPLLSERSQRHAQKVIETVKRLSQDVAFSVAADTAVEQPIAALGVNPTQWAFIEGVAA
ncbi:MAG: phage tail protein I [Rhodoblastus sp.]